MQEKRTRSCRSAVFSSLATDSVGSELIILVNRVDFHSFSSDQQPSDACISKSNLSCFNYAHLFGHALL